MSFERWSNNQTAQSFLHKLMLSRRNVRVKVMQVLYMQNRDKTLQFSDILKRYKKSVEHSFELYLFCMLQFMRIANYAIHDKAKRNSKLRPSKADLAFSAKLAENPLSQSVISSEAFERILKNRKLLSSIDRDNSRRLYAAFAKTDDYQSYLNKEEADNQEHQQILLSLFRFCAANESFNEIMEDKYPNWLDDKSLIVGSIKKTIRSLPGEEDFFEAYRPTADTIEEFGQELLHSVYYDDDELLEMISPVLNNWDVDRVAILDMIILKMAISELVSFPTIPTKVTLNEFVEISKLYSTDKSKDFINGILDRLLKQLIKDGKISKEGRGLQD